MATAMSPKNSMRADVDHDNKKGQVDNELEHWALDSGAVADSVLLENYEEDNAEQDWDVEASTNQLQQNFTRETEGRSVHHGIDGVDRRRVNVRTDEHDRFMVSETPDDEGAYGGRGSSGGPAEHSGNEGRRGGTSRLDGEQRSMLGGILSAAGGTLSRSASAKGNLHQKSEPKDSEIYARLGLNKDNRRRDDERHWTAELGRGLLWMSVGLGLGVLVAKTLAAQNKR